MKAFRNWYVTVSIVLFVIAIATLGLFVGLFSTSTSVDGTTVGNIYVGDQKEEKDLKKTLDSKVKSWKEQAVYTISFQNIDVVIGKEEKIDENGDVVKDENGEVVYNYNGLYFLDFDFTTTKKYMSKDKSNEAYYIINEEKKNDFFNTLVEAYGDKFCDSNNLYFDILLNDIEKDARAMKSIADYNLYDYISPGWKQDIKTVEVNNLSKARVDDILEVFDGQEIVLLPQAETPNKLGFSAIEFFSQEQFKSLTSSDMSIIATGIAAVVRNTSLTVTLKNQGYISDRYYAVDGVMTARINVKDGTDLRIINPETSSYVITLKEGNPSVDGTSSLVFVITGCEFINNYSWSLEKKELNYEVIYNDRAMTFDYEEEKAANPDLVGIDTEFQGGVYYYIYQEGEKTYLYSYKKTVTHINGDVEVFEVYPKQEFFEGQDEYRYWTREGYKA